VKQYQDVVRTVLERGTRKENRTGVDALSAFNVNYEIDVAAGFPLLTTKSISWKNIVVENLWFLSGERHVGLLRKHNCKFWEPWADEKGFVPSAYGNFWRNFPTVDEQGSPTTIDQVQWVLSELAKNPMSRRLVISAWEPGNAQASKLPPCHAFYVFNVQMDRAKRPRLCLHLTQRSCDVALGLPYNIAGYALILSLFSRFADIPVGTFAHTLIDAHIYTDKPDGSMAEYDHVPGLREQLTRQPRRLPRLRIAESIKTLADIRHLLEADTDTLMQHFVLEGYDPHPAINFKVAV
jgi:thymidylate synthase